MTVVRGTIIRVSGKNITVGLLDRSFTLPSSSPNITDKAIEYLDNKTRVNIVVEKGKIVELKKKDSNWRE